jgi:hypothetical protein
LEDVELPLTPSDREEDPMSTETSDVTSPEGMPPIVGNPKRGFHVPGEAGAQYEITARDPVESIDDHLRALLRTDGVEHPDVDRLLDARSALALATRLGSRKAVSVAAR